MAHILPIAVPQNLLSGMLTGLKKHSISSGVILYTDYVGDFVVRSDIQAQ